MSFAPLKAQEQDQTKGNACNGGHINKRSDTKRSLSRATLLKNYQQSLNENKL